MSEPTHSQTEFLNQISDVIEKNIANEQFGVSELADEMNMSRSNLLRKVKKETKLSVSQLISQVRLKRAMKILRTSNYNVSEVSHQVGFSSTSYFIKCFREFYGYPPGEVGKRVAEQREGITSQEEDIATTSPDTLPKTSSKKKLFAFAGAAVVVILAIILFNFGFNGSADPSPEKSIAVLPFKNDSNDSTNLYLINGLMEATLNNLQQIQGLKVTSRTSVEKYRNTTKSIPEMAEELGVNYFVEGSGQKLGDRIVLNIQLVEAKTDKHLWATQFRKDAKDIFDLQEEIARSIAKEIEVLISPEDEKKITKKPTDDPVAYDYYLKGKDLFYQSTGESLQKAIPWFKKAIELDNKFALAYAGASMVYYYLDIFQREKKYIVELSSCADNAVKYDPTSSESLIAKGLSFANKGHYDQAVVWLEKALALDPNSGLVVHFLTEFYNMHVPNASKYLQYAIKGVQIDITSHDSVTTGYKYFHLANALVQCGFIDEALRYVNKSLEYDSTATFARYVKVWIIFAKNRDLEEAKTLMLKELKRDPNRYDIIQEVGKIYFYSKDYANAWRYYSIVAELRQRLNLNIFEHEDLNLAAVLKELGENEKSEFYVKSYKNYADNVTSMYKHLHLSSYYIWTEEYDKALEHLRLFSKEENYQFWLMLWNIDPCYHEIMENPEFRRIMGEIETKFWNTNRKLRTLLEEEGIV